MMGYAIGEGIDQRHAKPVAVNLTPDSCDCRKGDYVRLALVSGEELTGPVKEIAPGQFIRLISHIPSPVAHQPVRTRDVPWVEIRTLEVLETPATWRYILTASGLVIDVTLYVAVSVYASAMRAVSSLR